MRAQEFWDYTLQTHSGKVVVCSNIFRLTQLRSKGSGTFIKRIS